MTQSYFEDIDLHLSSALMQAQFSVRAAVAWCTDPNIIRVLAVLQKRGVSVELIVNDDKINRKIDYTSITSNGGKVFYSDSASDIMHNKFCIIDDNIVITGSYNWTKHASLNDESISITENDQEEDNKYNSQFDSILFAIRERARLINTSVKEKRSNFNSKNSLVELDLNFMDKCKIQRYNKTIAIDIDIYNRIGDAAYQFNTSRGRIIEKAFSAWWAAVQKMTNK